MNQLLRKNSVVMLTAKPLGRKPHPAHPSYASRMIDPITAS